MPRKSKRIPYLVLLYMLLLVSCHSTPPSMIKITAPIEPQPESSPTPEMEITATSTLTFLPSPTPSKPIESTISLSPQGPWLVYQKEDHLLYAVNANGTGITTIGDSSTGTYPYTGSESSGLLATMIDGKYSFSVDLVLIEFPDLQQKRRIALYSYWETEPENNLDLNIPMEASSSDPKWSPDGSQIAFVASIDGPSLDLYLYDSTLDQIKRLSSGDNHAADPHWSPNGEWIVHSEVSEFNGWLVEALWAASADGKQMKWLFAPEGSWTPWILEWVGEDSFICILRSSGGEQIIRHVDISDGTVTILFPEYLHTIPAVDPITGAVAFSPMLGVKDVEPMLNQNGIYIISPPSRQITLVVQDKWGSYWDQGTNQFVTIVSCVEEPDGYIVFDGDGNTSCESLQRIEKSPNSRWQLVFDSHPFFSEASTQIRVFDKSNNQVGIVPNIKNGDVHWLPDESGFFILEDDSLYHVELPSLTVRLIDRDVVPEVPNYFLTPRRLPNITFVSRN